MIALFFWAAPVHPVCGASTDTQLHVYSAHNEPPTLLPSQKLISIFLMGEVETLFQGVLMVTLFQQSVQL